MHSRGFHQTIIKINKQTKDSFNGSLLTTGCTLSYNFSFKTFFARFQPWPVITGLKYFHNTNLAFHHAYAHSASPPRRLLLPHLSFWYLPVPQGPAVDPPAAGSHLKILITASFEI